MDSSDSDDDCYGNTAQRLQKLKNKYTEDQIKSTNILNESSEIEETYNAAEIYAAKPTITAGKTKTTADKRPEKVEVIESEEPDDVIMDEMIASSSTIVTRSAAKRSASDANLNVPLNTRARRKTSTVLNNNVTNVTKNTNDSHRNRNANKTVSRGRSRGRRSNIRGRNIGPSFLETRPYIPTYSVGNTDEYPDQSDNQQLFSSNSKSDDVVVIEENDLDENEELSVKVYWQSSEFAKFTIRRYQKLLQIFEYFSNKMNVCLDKLLFTFNDKIISPDDTPDSINYNIVKFIDGGVIKQSVSNLIRKTDKNEFKDGVDGIQLKFQCQNVKKPFETVISLDDKLSKAMMLCAEHFEISLGNLKFEFDGDCISGKYTARDLELEGGECIDVKIIS